MSFETIEHIIRARIRVSEARHSGDVALEEGSYFDLGDVKMWDGSEPGECRCRFLIGHGQRVFHWKSREFLSENRDLVRGDDGTVDPSHEHCLRQVALKQSELVILGIQIAQRIGGDEFES